MLKKPSKKLLSVVMAANSSASIRAFLNNIQETVRYPDSVEVLITIDDSDKAMQLVLEEAIKSFRFEIRYFQMPRLDGCYSLHLGYQQLFEMANKESYFFQILNEEVRFKTQGWDIILNNYIKFFPDDVFRLKISQFKFRNYYCFHDCGYVPDKFSFMTRKWIELAGGVGDSWETDSWHQYIDYHLGKTDGVNGISGIFRSIPISDITLYEDRSEQILDFQKVERRTQRITQERWRMYRPEAQQKFRYIATKMLAYIWAKNKGLEDFSINENNKVMLLRVIDNQTGEIQKMFYYCLSPLYVRLKNLYFLYKNKFIKYGK